jgi:hypothetical protein
MSSRLCKYGCGHELTWDTKTSSFKEQDGTPHDKTRCESLRKNPEAPKSKETLIPVMIGNEAKPILEAIKSERSLHWRDVSRDGITVLELYAEGKA